ncbi:hypothetical protein D9M70_495680 [compost metagenome]
MAALLVGDTRLPWLPALPAVVAAERQAKGADHGDGALVLHVEIEERLVRALLHEALRVGELARRGAFPAARVFEQQTRCHQPVQLLVPAAATIGRRQHDPTMPDCPAIFRVDKTHAGKHQAGGNLGLRPGLAVIGGEQDDAPLAHRDQLAGSRLDRRQQRHAGPRTDRRRPRQRVAHRSAGEGDAMRQGGE